MLDLPETFLRNLSLSAEIGADDVEEELGRVRVRRDRVSDLLEVAVDVGNATEIACLPAG